MLELKWDDSMNVDVKDMNMEHIQLIAIMNRLSSEFVQKFSRPTLKSSLEELIKYTKFHFHHEEQFLEKMAYPETETHKQLHKNLVTTLDTYYESYMSGADLDEKFFEFLHMWLKSHIRGLDVQYGNYAKTHAIAD